MPAAQWPTQLLMAVVLVVAVFGDAWLNFASINGFFDGMTRGLRGDDEP
jgi:hypothetical protein